MENNLDGIIMSYIKCENFCNSYKQLEDKIDDTIFTRTEKCDHYDLKMVRKIINNELMLIITAKCKICGRAERKEFREIENKFEFECCDQQKIVFNYRISLKNKKKEGHHLIDDLSNSEDGNSNLISDYGQEQDNQKMNNVSDVDIKIIDLYPWDNIAETNKINILFKYYKNTQVNYKIHCSKDFYFADIIKEFKKNCNIDKVTYSICDAKELDGEKTIRELRLENNSLVFVK